MLLVRVSRSAFSVITNSSCGRTCSLRDSTYPQWGVLQIQPQRLSLPLKFTDASVRRINFTFLLHEFKSRFSKHVISITLKKRCRRIYRIWESEERFVCSQKPVDVSGVNRKTFLDSTCPGLKTMRQVSLYLPDLEMNWTSSFLVQSDRLAIVLHLLLGRVFAVVKPAEHEFAHRPRQSPEAVSRCSKQNRRSTLCSVGGRPGGLPRKSSCPATCLSSVKSLWSWFSASCLGLITCGGWGAQRQRHSDYIVDVRRV